MQERFVYTRPAPPKVKTPSLPPSPPPPTPASTSTDEFINDLSLLDDDDTPPSEWSTTSVYPTSNQAQSSTSLAESVVMMAIGTSSTPPPPPQPQAQPPPQQPQASQPQPQRQQSRPNSSSWRLFDHLDYIEGYAAITGFAVVKGRYEWEGHLLALFPYQSPITSTDYRDSLGRDYLRYLNGSGRSVSFEDNCSYLSLHYYNKANHFVHSDTVPKVHFSVQGADIVTRVSKFFLEKEERGGSQPTYTEYREPYWTNWSPEAAGLSAYWSLRSFNFRDVSSFTLWHGLKVEKFVR